MNARGKGEELCAHAPAVEVEGRGGGGGGGGRKAAGHRAQDAAHLDTSLAADASSCELLYSSSVSATELAPAVV